MHVCLRRSFVQLSQRSCKGFPLHVGVGSVAGEKNRDSMQSRCHPEQSGTTFPKTESLPGRNNRDMGRTTECRRLQKEKVEMTKQSGSPGPPTSMLLRSLSLGGAANRRSLQAQSAQKQFGRGASVRETLSKKPFLYLSPVTIISPG